MKRKMLVHCMFLIVVFFLVSTAIAGEKAEEKTVKGMIVLHEDTGDVKIVTKDYEYVTVYFDKKTKVEATVKSSIADLAKEPATKRLPKGTVTFVMKDGKPVAKKISYKARTKWAIKKKAKK